MGHFRLNHWIDFFRDERKAVILPELLSEKRVCIHPWIFGELMMGDLGIQREVILDDLTSLHQLPIHDISELSDFVENEKLFGRGLSFIDAQLIYSCLLHDCFLWTKDR